MTPPQMFPRTYDEREELLIDLMCQAAAPHVYQREVLITYRHGRSRMSSANSLHIFKVRQ